MVVGVIAGLVNGNTQEAFSNSMSTASGGFDSVFAGVGAAAFAYEGWMIATSINSELRDAKKNLPRALVIGCALIMVIYIAYFVGLSGGAPIEALRTEGAGAAFRNLFGNVGSTVISAFIVVSCLGTLNGLMLANTRSLYSLSVRGNGPRPTTFAQLDTQTNMPMNASALALLFCGAWFFYFYGANLTAPIFGPFCFDSSELPIITVYALYIPIFIMFIKKEGKNNVFKNVVMPILAIVCSLFMIFVAIYAHGITKYQAAAANGEFSFPVLFYLIVFAVIMAIGALLYKPRKKE
jgi:APA family basic amino acid/polyamine antiporter